MHVNFSHPRQEDFTRLLSMIRSRPDDLQAASALRCLICLGFVAPKQAVPASVPEVAQFADKVQLDIVYMMDLAGTAYANASG